MRHEAYRSQAEGPLGEEGGAVLYDHRLMRRLLRYLSPSAGLVVLATALLILFSLVSLAGPLITRIGIDEYIAKGDLRGLTWLSLLWFGILAATAALQYAQIFTISLVGQRTVLYLREEIYRHLQRLPIAYYDRTSVGRLITRATNDVEVLDRMFTSGVVAIFGDLFALIGIMVILAVMNLRLALATFAALPVLFFVSIRFRRTVRVAFRDTRTALAQINAYLQESLSGIAVLKSFRREKANDAEFDRLADDHLGAMLRTVKAFASYFPLVEATQSITVALVLWYGGGQAVQGALSFGALVAFIQYVGRFFRPIRDLSDKYNILQDAMTSSERIFALLDEPAEPEPPAPHPAFDPAGEIRLEDCEFAYGGGPAVLRGLSAHIPAGRTTAIVGATGSGKTTLAGLLARFYDADAGRITIGGVDIREIPRAEVRRGIGIVEQEVFLFSGTIRENLGLWGGEIGEEQLLRGVRASHAAFVIDRLEQGLDSPVGERGAGFSSGERQLLACARALAFDRPILILDEATASVDSDTEAHIQEALRTLLKGRTAIVIAHRLSTIRHADQILVMHKGKISEQGTHDELMARQGIYAKLHQLQFEGV